MKGILMLHRNKALGERKWRIIILLLILASFSMEVYPAEIEPHFESDFKCGISRAEMLLNLIAIRKKNKLDYSHEKIFIYGELVGLSVGFEIIDRKINPWFLTEACSTITRSRILVSELIQELSSENANFKQLTEVCQKGSVN
jgi:hypothetical protein